MKEITWLDVIKIMIPVLAVILAGIFALFNLRHSIRLQARNKWKEDFRQYVSDYLESLINLNFTFLDYVEDTKKNDLNRETITKASTAMSETTARFQKIRFMLGTDSVSRELIQHVKLHEEELADLLDEKKINFDLEETTAKICDVAKRIYDNKK